MDNSNYMDNVLQTFLLIQSSPDEVQVGMVDSFLNNQVDTRTILRFGDLMSPAVTHSSAVSAGPWIVYILLFYSDGRNYNWNGITFEFNYDNFSGVAVPTNTRSQFKIIK